VRIVFCAHCVVMCAMCVVDDEGNKGDKNVWDSSKCSWKCPSQNDFELQTPGLPKQGKIPLRVTVSILVAPKMPATMQGSTLLS